jgi:hypothetical protein
MRGILIFIILIFTLYFTVLNFFRLGKLENKVEELKYDLSVIEEECLFRVREQDSTLKNIEGLMEKSLCFPKK